ncbi:MAG: hypothetical protein QNJ30_18585 [Kiloniellales bacterium]|nr:hypothetical protein [Kiloniellales bacterium]
MRWTLASVMAASLLPGAALGNAQDEEDFRALCALDTGAEKCDCYLVQLQETLSAADYRTFLGALLANAKKLKSGIELSPHLISIDEEAQDLRKRITQASDHGLTACEIDYHE